ncbi:alpha/beta fold hydrolase [Clostridium tarantellae]|uniref:Alpha/beta hydrolase n=1 Tax=Clostridium tarantellae TaxID=39493 RepID=A0A6I1MNV6_9CLOT|nr:alpha/beta hydrolase [Clostridium tarantellae]MPQ45105.1 alpha/beta hydrolase [Clostridium tarantellae]
MENTELKSYWNIDLKGKFTDKNSDRLCIVLPGIAYSIDRSYLDYSKQLALELDYDVLQMEYGFQIARKEFNVEKEFNVMATETINAIKASISKEYNEILIIGKSIGTCVQTLLNKKLKNSIVRNIYISPIEQTVKKGIKENSLVITGTKDPLIEPKSIEKIKNIQGVNLIVIDDANHALDIEGDVVKTIDMLQDIIIKEKEFILNR